MRSLPQGPSLTLGDWGGIGAGRARASAAIASFARLVGQVVRRDRWLVILTVTFSVASMLVTSHFGAPAETEIFRQALRSFAVVVPFFLIALLCWRAAVMAIRVGPERPLDWLAHDIRDTLLDADRLVSGAIAVTAMSLTLGAYSGIKPLIPEIDPFSWDPLFAEIDRVIHGGYAPHEWLWPLLGSPYVTTAINAAYHGWFFLMYFIAFIAMVAVEKPRARNTFLCAFVLAWSIGGSLLAILFASGGPVYFQGLGYGDAFVPLMASLQAFAEVSPVWALEVQATLWDGYAGDGAVKGISAMPSMHVTSAVLLALYAFHYRRWAGWLVSIFAVVILLGSVHLGWHYAIDGYAGVLLALACWAVSAWLVRDVPERRRPTPAVNAGSRASAG